MKIISMYLPQFHRVKENDEWWGEGFTEWTTLKKAEPLVDNHRQPRRPLDDKYYDLQNKSTMIWQSQLMKEYGVDGQCFYHYWFKDGRMILEKPAENLLGWTDVDMPFCFCWANETWARTWSNALGKNVWADKFEKKDEQGNGILLEQKYGDESAWRDHFVYLLKFFKDPRYIKIDGKPVFVIYKPTLIECLKPMIASWRKWAQEEGFADLYIIGANSNERIDSAFDKTLIHEPVRAMATINERNQARTQTLSISYENVWDEIIKYRDFSGKAIYGGFVDYDDTPRRGMAGTIISDATPEKFGKYLARLIAKNKVAGNEITFINAWNEWGESMYLEPDDVFEYAYLSEISEAKKEYTCHISEFNNSDSDQDVFYMQRIKDLQNQNALYEGYWRILNAWMNMRESGKRIDEYLEKQGISEVAIYGMGMLGKHLLYELKQGKTRINFGIDRNGGCEKDGIYTYLPTDELPETQMIIVTATHVYEQVKEMLKRTGNKNIVSLESIIKEME